MLQVASKYLNDLECFVLSSCLSEKSWALQCNIDNVCTIYISYVFIQKLFVGEYSEGPRAMLRC